MNLYKDDQDYFNFLKRIKLTLGTDSSLQRESLQTLRIKPLPENSFSIVCYCLMPNHFHFLIKQNTNISISTLINKTCTSYSKYFNKKYNHIGHIFQDRFKAIHVENNEYLLWLSAYIHQNPKVAEISDLDSYKWSSYLDYVNLNNNEGICDKDVILSQLTLDDYVSFVENSHDAIKQNKMIDKGHLLLD